MLTESGSFASMENGKIFGFAIQHRSTGNYFHAVDPFRFFFNVMQKEEIDISDLEGKIETLRLVHSSSAFYASDSGGIYRKEESAGLTKQTDVYINSSDIPSSYNKVKSYCDLSKFCEELAGIINLCEANKMQISDSRKTKVREFFLRVVEKTEFKPTQSFFTKG